MGTYGKHERHRPPEQEERRRGFRRTPFFGKIFMLIGFLTVLYLLITYVIIPILASLTVS